MVKIQARKAWHFMYILANVVKVITRSSIEAKTDSRPHSSPELQKYQPPKILTTQRANPVEYKLQNPRIKTGIIVCAKQRHRLDETMVLECHDVETKFSKELNLSEIQNNGILLR